MGSVKDLEIIEKPTSDAMGVGRFHFSDRYSVFDWGEMPDQIEGKGEALCTMGAYCFEKLEEMGIRTHYKGLMDKRGNLANLRELNQPSNIMEVNLVNVYKPEARGAHGKIEFDYSIYTPSLKNCLIPLEIIYRNGLPEGSSVFKRLVQGKVKVENLGLDHTPVPGERLAKPIFDVSTKLEDADRYITWKEAKEMAGLTNIEFDNERKLMVVDVVGTLDECRFTYDGVHVSKEVARQYYKKTGWYQDVEEAKRASEKQDILDWKALCKSQPPKLDPQLKEIISGMYMAAANELTGMRLFETPTLAEMIKKYREYIGEKK
jgi:phosphoribosylaminoimidazole-succinocarboxamide synthase